MVHECPKCKTQLKDQKLITGEKISFCVNCNEDYLINGKPIMSNVTVGLDWILN